MDGAGGDVAAAGGRRCGRTRPGAFVNLKHERVRVPDHVLAVFGELCRPGRIDSLLKSLDGLIKPLERMLAPGLEAAVREVEAVRGQEVTAERLAETGGADLGGVSGPSASRRPARRSRSTWRSPASYSASSEGGLDVTVTATLDTPAPTGGTTVIAHRRRHGGRRRHRLHAVFDDDRPTPRAGPDLASPIRPESVSPLTLSPTLPPPKEHPPAQRWREPWGGGNR